MTQLCISSPENEDKKDIALTASAVNKQLTDDHEADDVKGDKPKKVPSKDSPLRWTALVIYLTISTPLLVASIVLVAIL